MMSALFSAVSGLKSDQYALDVIANNISNVNTTGYKASRVSFSDLLSQTLKGATSSTSTKGSTNANQVGLGVSVASTDLNMTVGSTESTGIATDVAISGDGFFIVSGGSEGEYQFTREGDFTIDSDGNLTVNGYKVCGWEKLTNGSYDTNVGVTALNVYSDSYNGNKKVMAAKASTEATLSGNLPTSADAVTTTDTTLTSFVSNSDASSISSYDKTATITAYDAQGNSYDSQVELKKAFVDSSNNTYWYWTSASSSSNATASGSGYIEFDSSGKIVGTYDSSGTATTTTDTGSVTLTPSSTMGTDAFTLSLDFSNLSQYTTSSSTSSITATADGYAAGELQSISIGSDGTITGTYSNSKTQSLGMIALANFTNPEGLKKLGDNLYAATASSGTFSTGVVAGSSGTGSLASGELEMSNVDLAEQFSEMMISQRAYQANTKVISTADSMLQSLINMVG